MKIYITNLLVTNIAKNITRLSEYILDVNGKEIIELHSLDYGLHIIEKDKVFRHEPDFNPHYEAVRDFYGYDLLINKSKCKLLHVVSQMPTNYIMTKMKIYEYKRDKKSQLKLVVRCIQPKTQVKALITNSEEPIDFYFEYDSHSIDLTDKFFQEEFNMFLSELN